MELTKQEKSAAFWGGTVKGLVKGLVLGAIIGSIAAGGLYLLGVTGVLGALHMGGLIPFVTLAGTESVFFPLTLAVFNGMIMGVAHAFSGGRDAVNAAREAKTHQAFAEKIMELDGRGMMVEQAVSQTPRIVSEIVARGSSRSQQGHAAAEQARSDAPSSSKTIH